jgi:hypothetical protein
MGGMRLAERKDNCVANGQTPPVFAAFGLLLSSDMPTASSTTSYDGPPDSIFAGRSPADLALTGPAPGPAGVATPFANPQLKALSSGYTLQILRMHNHLSYGVAAL